MAYAEALGCREAVLLYPVRLVRPLDVEVGRIRVRTLGFELSGDLEAAGERLLERFLHRVSKQPVLGLTGGRPSPYALQFDNLQIPI